jgi:hypothetical protein
MGDFQAAAAYFAFRPRLLNMHARDHLDCVTRALFCIFLSGVLKLIIAGGASLNIHGRLISLFAR